MVIPMRSNSRVRSYPPLDRVLTYQNREIVRRFARDRCVTVDEARELFVETQKLLWLSAHPARPRCWAIHQRLRVLDEMWHNFILFTREYTTYCVTYYGVYLHHVPEPIAEPRTHHRAVQNGTNRAKHQLLPQMRFIARQLGIETVKKWYRDLPAKYGPHCDCMR
jgi:hypothetical protein